VRIRFENIWYLETVGLAVRLLFKHLPARWVFVSFTPFTRWILLAVTYAHQQMHEIKLQVIHNQTPPTRFFLIMVIYCWIVQD